ncbi:MAG: ATP-binding protein, partial [Pseudomonadota bacterium]
LRNFARRPQDELRDVPVREVIEETLALFEPQARKANVEVRFLAPTQDISAIGGRLRLQQVLLNLLSNALDAMTGQAKPVIEVTVERAQAQVIVAVRDFGPGLTDTARDQAFEPFFTTKDPGKGMGLGLSISYNIVEDFGGRLTAENHPEQGAVFRVHLLPSTVQDLAAE